MNALFPTVLTLSGIWIILSIEAQPLNADSSIEVMLEGITRAVMLEQPAKQFAEILLIVFDSFKLTALEQPLKALVPTLEIVSGRIISGMLEHPSKALFPIVVSCLKSTSVTRDNPAKPLFSTTLTGNVLDSITPFLMMPSLK